MASRISHLRSIAASPVILLGVAACVFFADLFLFRKVFLMRDGLFFYCKAQQYTLQSIHLGEFPFWDAEGIGKPFMGEPYSIIFYPFNLLFHIFKLPLALNLFYLLHTYLAGLAAYILGRQFGIRKSAALIAAMSCMFGSWLFVCMEYPPYAATATWLFFILSLLVRVGKAELAASGGLCCRLWRQKHWLVLLALLMAVQFLPIFLRCSFIPSLVTC
jgi:hypothetical protein